ncbi:MAG: hypothetical protein HC765_13015 [Brachymonas sp.]|nr:hypothetical protein [Brachymonas sp.]
MPARGLKRFKSAHFVWFDFYKTFSAAAIEKPKARHLTVKLDSGERLRLKSIAQAKQRTPHFIMREAVTRPLDTPSVKAKT